MSSSVELELQHNKNAADERTGLVSSSEIQSAKPNQDDGDMLPVMIDDALERLGIRQKLVPYIGGTGQIRNETIRQVLAEFWGTLLFQMFGGSAPAKDTSAPAANGFALVAVIYAFANISGGHLNPAVSFALMCTGHMKWWKALMYMVAQVLGAIFGALIYAALIPRLTIGYGANSPGCFGPAKGTSWSEVFGWETMMTFFLVMTVYASAVARPGHGNTAPLAIGLSLYASALSGGPYTGASLNPARTIGPAVVFVCNVGVSFIYIIAEFFGAACAAGLSIFLYGRNPDIKSRGT